MSGHSRPSSRGKEVFSHVLTDRQGQVQNVKAARVYIFGDDNVVDDDIDENVEFEMPSIRARRGQNEGGGSSSIQQAEEEEDLFYEKEIAEGETLQNLSLKYSCPVSELKRVNNLIKDQDFFALRKLKIPMRRHGYLSEIVRQEEAEALKQNSYSQRNGATLPSDSDVPSDAICSDVDISDPETHRSLLRTVSIGGNFSKQGRKANRFLKKMDKDLSKFRQSTVTERESLDEVISVLTNKSFYPLQSRQKLNGADCGIRWWMLVLAAVAFTVLVFIVYYVYVNFIRDTSGGS
ncbi:lysM and putative peptidoglycan-binding domain-containing protein 3-like [Babylonia areolata]|uniref:lysM and putative peptidoglycan-binding domain-containing protein 3-like n=1 Tax=Babylonia areolata TaxID=304850 RepID=UPI003FD3A5C5